MMPTTRKRKLTSLDSDSSHPSKKEVRESSPVKRRSPRKPPQSPMSKKLSGRVSRRKCPSPQKSPLRAAGSPAKSPRKLSFKQTMVTSSFYGKHKPVYLTPLERKAIKESLPPPPPPPPALPSPSSRPMKQQRKKKKNIAGGNKPRKVSAGARTSAEAGIRSYATSTKKITLQKLNLSVTAKPPAATTSAPPAAAPPAAAPLTTVTKPAAESKKAITITFSNLKPKPKIFVGAAFFGTGKKPKSMYKKSAPKSSTRPASVQQKSRAAAPSAAASSAPAAALTTTMKAATTMQQQQQHHHHQKQQQQEKQQQQQQQQEKQQQVMKRQTTPEKVVVEPLKAEEKNLDTKQRHRFDWSDWIEELDSPQTLSSPQALRQKYGINKRLSVVLTRTPTPSSSSSSSSSSFIIKSQEASVTDGVSEAVFDLSDISPNSATCSPPKKAVYPIFSSASRRLKKAAVQAPLSCSTPSGHITSLQASAARERSCVRKKREKQDDDQLIIDAGQKRFGATTCGSCGMIYSADNPEDNFQHTQFHQRFIDSIKFVGWKKERVVSEFWDGKILLVMPDDPKYAVKKAEDVRLVADSELGFQQVILSKPSQAKTYLFINTHKMVVGCLVAEPIRQAFRVLDQPDGQKDMTRDDFMERHRAWCCSTVPEAAVCGISRIWVFSLARRHGIATRMLDTVRSSFTYGSHLTKQEVAFSDPTPDGKVFATKYCNTPTFLVYNFIA